MNEWDKHQMKKFHGVIGPQFFRTYYVHTDVRKKFWDKKSMLNFSRQAHNAKVTD